MNKITNVLTVAFTLTIVMGCGSRVGLDKKAAVLTSTLPNQEVTINDTHYSIKNNTLLKSEKLR